MADGILTPAVSVTSAVGGIAVAKPSVESDIVPISVVSAMIPKPLTVCLTVRQAFLVGLFLVQRFGTAKLSFVFAPGQSKLRTVG